MKHKHYSTGKWHNEGTMAWKDTPAYRPPVRTPRQEPNYRFFQGIAISFGITSLVLWVLYLISRIWAS